MARKQNMDDALSVLKSFRSIVKALRLADRAGLKEHGLGASQLYVLHELKNDAPLSVNDLAERTATDQSTVSVVVAKLIAKGFVASERATADARRLELTLTARGQQLLRKLPPPIQSLIIEGVQQLPAARSTALAESLRDICEVLGIADENPPLLFSDEPKPRRSSAPRKTGGASAKTKAKPAKRASRR